MVHAEALAIPNPNSDSVNLKIPNISSTPATCCTCLQMDTAINLVALTEKSSKTARLKNSYVQCTTMTWTIKALQYKSFLYNGKAIIHKRTMFYLWASRFNLLYKSIETCLCF